MYSLKVLTCHRTCLYNLIFLMFTISRIFTIRNPYLRNIIPPQQWSQSAVLTSCFVTWKKRINDDNSADKEIPLAGKNLPLCYFPAGLYRLWCSCTSLCVLTSLIQLLNLSKKDDGRFWLQCYPVCYWSIVPAINVSCSPLDIIISLINLSCNY